MAKMSRQERAELEAKLKADDDADDYDPEITVGHKDGSYDRMPYSLARQHYPDRYKDPDPPKEPPAPKDAGKDEPGGTRFAGRRVS